MLDFEHARPRRAVKAAGLLGLGTALTGLYEYIFRWEFFALIPRLGLEFLGLILRLGWESLVWTLKAVVQLLMAVVLLVFSGGHFEYSWPSWWPQSTITLTADEQRELRTLMEAKKAQLKPGDSEAVLFPDSRSHWVIFRVTETTGDYVSDKGIPLKEKCIVSYVEKAELRDGNLRTPRPYVFEKTGLKWPEAVRSCEVNKPPKYPLDLPTPYSVKPFQFRKSDQGTGQ